MNYQEENELLLAQTVLPNLYDYSAAVPGVVKQSIFCTLCTNNCLLYSKTIIPESDIDNLYEDSF